MMVTDTKIILKNEDADFIYSSVSSFIKMTEKLSEPLLSGDSECSESIPLTSNSSNDALEHTSGAPEASYLSSAVTDTSPVTESVSCKSSHSSDSDTCLQKPEQFLEPFKYSVAKPKNSFKKTVQELSQYSRKELQIIVEDLTRTVEEVSSELVQLLLENDALQQESDARNIAIEQLLKLTVVKVSESDLKPIQMSVILPEGDEDQQTDEE